MNKNILPPFLVKLVPKLASGAQIIEPTTIYQFQSVFRARNTLVQSYVNLNVFSWAVNKLFFAKIPKKKSQKNVTSFMYGFIF